MKKVNLFLLLFLMFLGMPLVGGSKAFGLQRNDYAGVTLGGQTQRYTVKINDQMNGQTHSTDATRISPEVGVFIGSRTRLRSRFSTGLEMAATFFLSNIKRNINSGQTGYELNSGYYAVQASATLGYFLKTSEAHLYLKLGADIRNFEFRVNVPGITVPLTQKKRLLGGLLGMGVEAPLSKNFYTGVEGMWRFYRPLKLKGKTGQPINTNITPGFDSLYIRFTYTLNPKPG